MPMEISKYSGFRNKHLLSKNMPTSVKLCFCPFMGLGADKSDENPFEQV